MIQIQVQAIPNQTLTASLSGNFYQIALNQTLDALCATIYVNNILVISGVRIVAGAPIIPYQYLENGNFALLTMDDELPNYLQLGVTQSLVFASMIELATIRSGG